jgi:basic membrane protein A
MYKKLYLILALIMVTALLLPACAPAAPACADEEVFCVGLVTDVGKIDDKSFNQSAWEGVNQAKEAGIADQVQYIETTDSKDYAKNIGTFADEGYDVIVTVGFGLGEATNIAAAQYPDVKFLGVDQFQAWEFDGDDSTNIDNVAGLNFPEDNAGFLVGALAAMMSKTGKIGSVLGTDAVPPVWRFGEGYKAGAAYIDAEMGTTTEVFVVYHNDVGFDKTFTDPEWGKATADSMIDQGADVIFGAGGKTGNGAVTAAAQRGVYAVGVDTDQYYVLPEAASRMLSSAMKLITPGVFDLIKQAAEGNYPAGNYFGDAGYAPFHDLENEVPADVKAKMEEIAASLIDGSIKTNVPPVKPTE